MEDDTKGKKYDYISIVSRVASKEAEKLFREYGYLGMIIV